MKGTGWRKASFSEPELFKFQKLGHGVEDITPFVDRKIVLSDELQQVAPTLVVLVQPLDPRGHYSDFSIKRRRKERIRREKPGYVKRALFSKISLEWSVNRTLLTKPVPHPLTGVRRIQDIPVGAIIGRLGLAPMWYGAPPLAEIENANTVDCGLALTRAREELVYWKMQQLLHQRRESIRTDLQSAGNTDISDEELTQHIESIKSTFIEEYPEAKEFINIRGYPLLGCKVKDYPCSAKRLAVWSESRPRVKDKRRRTFMKKVMKFAERLRNEYPGRK